MRTSFDFVAPVYDFLAYIVYGRNLIRAKKAFIHLVPSNANLLLMGGGTGNILNYLLEKNPSVTVDFVEPSRAMIRIAQKNLEQRFRSKVNFICGDHRAIPPDKMYDAVTSFFVIDCFQQHEALEFARTITGPLKENGWWLFADFFYTPSMFRRALIWFMYRFFRLVAGISARQLPDYNQLFKQLNFTEKYQEPFLGGLIRSKAFCRIS